MWPIVFAEVCTFLSKCWRGLLSKPGKARVVWGNVVLSTLSQSRHICTSEAPGWSVAHPSQSQTIKGGSKVTFSDSMSLSRKVPASLLPSSAPSQKTSDTPQPSSAVGNSRHCGGYHSNLSRSNAGRGWRLPTYDWQL